METPSPGFILSRAIMVLALIIAVLFGVRVYKNHQRKSAIVGEMTTLAGESSFFQQFYAEDARKALVRSVGLMLEAEKLGVAPDTLIDLAFGIKTGPFDSPPDRYDAPPRQQLIRATLRHNYENALKLGYKSDPRTLAGFRDGTLPPLEDGPLVGKSAVVAPVIDPGLSPGLEKVLANLRIRPPATDDEKPSDIELTAAKQLARDLFSAGLIEENVEKRILEKLDAAVDENAATSGTDAPTSETD